MKTSEFKQHLDQYPNSELSFILPDGRKIPAHAHITEVGRVEKKFMDCGGKIRSTATCSLQAWVADDVEHRVTAGKLSAIFDEAAALVGNDDPPIEIEYEDVAISQYPVIEAIRKDDALLFQLEAKHTDCLAKDICIPEPSAAGCCSGTGCC